jgi:hypothetical protein
MKEIELVSKLDMAVIIAVIVCGAIWIEQSHRIIIDAPTHTEPALLAAAPACPDNDNVPYSDRCIMFLGSSYASGMNWQTNFAASTAEASPMRRNTGSREPRGD